MASADAPEPACPKCGAARRDLAAACPRCGLAADRMAGFESRRDTAVSPELVAAWDATLAAWDDRARHDALIGLVARHDAYAWAAARYRTRGDDPIAARELARIRKATEVTLLVGAAARPDDARKPYRALIAVLLLMLVAIVGGLLYTSALRDRAASSTPTAPAVK